MNQTVSTKKAAEMLNVGRSTVIRMVHRGDLDAHKKTLAKHSALRITVASINRVLQQRRVEPSN